MKFPKKAFVKIEGKNGEEYLIAYGSIDCIVDSGESAKIGVYELREIVEARGSVTVVTTTPVKKRR